MRLPSGGASRTFYGMAVIIKRVSPDAVRPIRQAILRPHQTVEECVFPGDDVPEAGHFGAYLADRLVSIGSIFRESPPGQAVPAAWRLRGMATLPEVRGQGCGAAVLDACIAHVRAHHGRFIWCNARTPAVGFYRRYGFATIGEEFELPGIGPHYVMECHLDDKETA